MAHYFDVIGCGIKQMHAQFSLLFGLHNAMVLLSIKVVLINKTEHCWTQPREDTQEKLDGDAFQLKDASVDLNEVCLQIT